MAAAAVVWLCFLTLQLTCAVALEHNHYRGTDVYHVSAGHFFMLRCLNAHSHPRVAWTRGDNSSLPAGTEVRDGSLLFAPVQVSHNGSYTCEKRDEARSVRMTFMVYVSTGVCPDPSETRNVSEGVSNTLPCQQTEILELNSSRNVRWMKDCLPVQQRGGEPVSVNKKGDLWLTAASKKDAGTYTCLIDLSLDGRNYTAARSLQLYIKEGIEILEEPEVVFPRDSVVMVEVGRSAELTCLAYTGSKEDKETMMYWTIDETYIEDHEELRQSWKYVHKRGMVYGQSTLSISKVRTEFLNVSICCHLDHPGGAKFGEAWLQEADHSVFYTSVAVCLASSLAILCLATAFFLFRVDLVLVYRKLLRHFPKQQVPDGKLYDAYVSFLHPDMSDETESFALQILPEELEGQHGYSLYIRGRDDCPGEAIHDVIAATLRQCRRLIIVLQPEGKTLETLPLRDNQNHMSYEQKIGLYDALTRNDPQVILVEMDGPVDYSRLPESLRYIKRKRGALKWRKAYAGSHKLTKLRSNKTFWKNMRYQMPAVPVRRRQAII